MGSFVENHQWHISGSWITLPRVDHNLRFPSGVPFEGINENGLRGRWTGSQTMEFTILRAGGLYRQVWQFPEPHSDEMASLLEAHDDYCAPHTFGCHWSGSDPAERPPAIVNCNTEKVQNGRYRL